jgi:hypothetical protein
MVRRALSLCAPNSIYCTCNMSICLSYCTGNVSKYYVWIKSQEKHLLACILFGLQQQQLH